MNYKLIKKIHKSVFIVSFMFLGLVSCYDSGFEEYVAPTGNINNIQPSTLFTSTTDADDNLSIVFRSYSTDATSYLWDFGDGNTSVEANPDYTYATGGLYKVKLTTTSSDGLVAVDSSNVAPVFVDFNISKIDSQVTFENLSSGAASLVWDFGDAESVDWVSDDTILDADYNPVHVYKTADTFVANLTVTNFLGAQVSVSKNIEGLVLSAVPDFTFTTSSLTATFTDDSFLAVSHSWDFGDGATSTDLNPTHTYSTKGTYNVTLTTKNSAGVAKSITKGVPVGGVDATFAAVILNGTIDDWVPGVYHKDDNNDGWEPVPPSGFKNGQDSPYTWSNSSLKTNAGVKAAGITTTENSGTHALKFSSSERRAYQPFTVEVGVEYTISMFVRTETTDDFTIYMLNNEVSDESDLTGNSDKVYVVSGNANSYTEHTFTFKATTSTAVFYAVPFSGVSGTSEIYLDDITIKTPGF
jgi:PKD repeat protein